MKNKKVMCAVLACIIMLTAGCGNNDYLKDKNKKIVVDPTTGQSLQKDIYCKPSEGTETYKLYKKYEKQMTIKLSKLPECSEFKINSNKTKSLWQLIFVKPLSWLILELGDIFKGWGMTKAYLGLSLICIGIAIRLIILPFNIKTQKQSQMMQKAQPELMRIEKKYAGKNDQDSMMAKSQETMMVYQKYKINPLSSCLIALIQLPIFFAFLQAIYKIPTIYEGEIFGWNLGTTPNIGIFTNHEWSYIVLVVLIILTTFFSFKYTMNNTPTAGAGDAGNQMKTMLYVMTIFITFASFSLPTAIALYWIASYAFVIAQTFIMKLIRKKKEEKEISSFSKKGNKNSSKKGANSKTQITDKLKAKEGMKYGKNK